MMRCSRIAYELLLLVLAAAPSHALTITPSAPSAKEGQTIALTADVAANWSLAPGSAGTLTPAADGKSATYVAPRSIIPQNALAGCQVMPNDSVFNTRIDRLPVESHSATWIGAMAAQKATLAGFDTAWGTSIGDHTTPLVPMTFKYTTATDGPWMIPQGAALKREQGNYNSFSDGNDHHIVAVNRDSCQFYETYDNDPLGLTFSCGRTVQCTAVSGWTFGAADYALPWGKGSTDAAGLPMAPLSLHLDEVKAGAVHHVVRYTAGCDMIQGHNAPYWPATGSNGGGGVDMPPYGARLRLKAGFDIAGVCGTNQSYTQPCTAILAGLQQYGMMLADIGSCGFGGSFAPAFITVDRDLNQDAAAHAALGRISGKIPISDFEAVDESSLVISSPSARVNPANGFVTPSPFAVVNATDKSNPQNARATPIGLQGVAIGMPSPTIAVMAGTPAYALPSWVGGTSNQGVTWSLVSGVGTVTSAGAYTAPASVASTTSAVLKAVSAADANAVAFLYVTVIPSGVNPTNGIRIDSAGHAPITDGNGNTWLADVGWEAGDPDPRPSDPAWPVPNPENAIYQTAAFTYGSDYVYNFVVPNGNYKVRFMFGADFDMGWGGNLATCVAKPSNYAPIDLETQGQIQIRNYNWPELVDYKCAVPVDAYAPAQVTHNTLEAAVRPALPLGGSGTPRGYVTGFEIIPDTSPPHLTITPSTATIAYNQTLQFYAVGWYMSNAATWKVTSGPGSIDANGLYSPPGTPVSGSVRVTVEAISQIDATKTATTAFSLTLGTLALSPANVTIVHGTTQQFTTKINGQPYTRVNWALSPSLGSITSAGLYSAPDTLSQDAVATLTATSQDDPSVSVSTTLHLKAATPAVFINAGDYWAPVTDEQGNVWSTDFGFSGGSQYDDLTFPVQGASAQMQPVYDSSHYVFADQSFKYLLPEPNGSYSVTLKFADYTNSTPPTPRYSEDVQINGQTVLSAFDPDAAAGNVTRTAVDRTFAATVTDKMLTLTFIGNPNGRGATISGIAVVPSGAADSGSQVSAGQPFAPTVYPNPWRSDRYSQKLVTFSPLPEGSVIKIFTVSGHKIKEFKGSGKVSWDLTNSRNDKVGSGLYIYLVTTPDGRSARGKLAIVH